MSRPKGSVNKKTRLKEEGNELIAGHILRETVFKHRASSVKKWTLLVFVLFIVGVLFESNDYSIYSNACYLMSMASFFYTVHLMNSAGVAFGMLHGYQEGIECAFETMNKITDKRIAEYENDDLS